MIYKLWWSGPSVCYSFSKSSSLSIKFPAGQADESVMNTLDNDLPKTAVLQIPSGSADLSNRRLNCKFYGMEARRLRLESAERVPLSTAVTVEYNDALFLGEVFSCSVTASGTFQAEIHVEQILTGLESLMGLRARLLGEGFPHRTAGSYVPVRAAQGV
jgi:hypothetical protein